MKFKIQSALFLMCVAASSVFAQGDLQVTVKNITETGGNIRVGLFNNESDFLKKAIEGKVVKASAAEVTIVFKNVKPGEYAVSVIQDKNENGKLDSGFMGIPNEPYGFSNDATGHFGPPSFEKAKFQVKGSGTSIINLH